MLPFLGNCSVCGKTVRTYRGLAGHLRRNTDSAHVELKTAWKAWRTETEASSYVNFLRCRKCGNFWEIKDKALKDRKRCPSCWELRITLGKRAYEASTTTTKQDSKPSDPATDREAKVNWVPGDPLYQMVVDCLMCGETIRSMMRRLGLTYKVVHSIAIHILGDGYRQFVLLRTKSSRVANLHKAHDQYRALRAEDKAALLKSRFGGSCSLELLLSSQLQVQGINDIHLNQWQAVPIDGVPVPREADIKLGVGDGRKIVILCDGEAFHGPGVIHGDPEAKIESDRQTALGFFRLGYSVARYSESEIHSGYALEHALQLLGRLQTHQRVYRNWHPREELVA